MTDEETFPHRRHAESAERVAEEFEEQSAQLGDRIEHARDDWEAKKADPGVPGAPPDPDDDQVSSDAPEADYPTKGSADELAADDGLDEGDDEAGDETEGDDEAGDEDDGGPAAL